MNKNNINKTTEELFLEYKKTESAELRNEIVEKNLYVAEYLARRYMGRGVELDDLVQVASFALVMAVTRYDPDKGAKFITFATPTIIGEIKKHFRDTMWSLKVPRRLKEISIKIGKVKDEIYETTGRIPTVNELAKIIGVSEEEILEALESGRSYATFSLDSEPEEHEDGDTSQFEKFLGEEEEGYAHFEHSVVLEKVMANLSPREKEIIKQRFVNEITQQELASALGVSQMTISRIEKAMKEKFRTEYNK